eukprot:scaffold19.g1814.t1
MNARAVTLQTVCCEGHNVTLVAMDAFPVEPVDEVGDPLTNQTPGNYWVASPDSYIVRRYSTYDSLPATPPPQPGSVRPWSWDFLNSINISSAVLGAAASPATAPCEVLGAMQPLPETTVTLCLNITAHPAPDGPAI